MGRSGSGPASANQALREDEEQDFQVAFFGFASKSAICVGLRREVCVIP